MVNRPGNRPSHEGAAEVLDRSIDLVRRGGFQKVLLRGDTDFTQTRQLDGWSEEGVGVVFGMDSVKSFVSRAEGLAEEAWEKLQRPVKRKRRRAKNVKQALVREKGYRNLQLLEEEVAEFDYCPRACQGTYRAVVLRKRIAVEKGQRRLFEEDQSDIPHINFGSVFLRPPCDEQSKPISPPTKGPVLFLIFRLKRDPLLLFNGHGDSLAAKLRPGNVHSAEDWDELLLPEIERQQAAGKRVAFRGDAAFAKPEVYEASEERGVQYAIRIPANKSLELEIEDILFRPPGRPSRKPLVRDKSFRYQAESWSKARRIVAQVEHHQGELFPLNELGSKLASVYHSFGERKHACRSFFPAKRLQKRAQAFVCTKAHAEPGEAGICGFQHGG